MKCILCLVDKNNSEFSDEHVFPEAIGGTLRIKTVCKQCNDYLGHSVDVHLAEHEFVRSIRLSLGLAGKSKTPPNPLERGVSPTDPTQKFRYVLDAEGQPESLYQVP